MRWRKLLAAGGCKRAPAVQERRGRGLCAPGARARRLRRSSDARLRTCHSQRTDRSPNHEPLGLPGGAVLPSYFRTYAVQLQTHIPATTCSPLGAISTGPTVPMSQTRLFSVKYENAPPPRIALSVIRTLNIQQRRIQQRPNDPNPSRSIPIRVYCIDDYLAFWPGL